MPWVLAFLGPLLLLNPFSNFWPKINVFFSKFLRDCLQAFTNWTIHELLLTHSDYQKLRPHTNFLDPHSSLFLSYPHVILVPQEAVIADWPSALILNEKAASPFWQSPSYIPPMKNSLKGCSCSQRSGIWWSCSFGKIGTSEITGGHLGTLVSLKDHCDLFFVSETPCGPYHQIQMVNSPWVLSEVQSFPRWLLFQQSLGLIWICIESHYLSKFSSCFPRYWFALAFWALMID